MSMSSDEIEYIRLGPRGYWDIYGKSENPHRSKGCLWLKPNTPRHKNMTPAERPYSYDEFFRWGNHASIEGANADYSDRLQQWDREKNNRCLKHFPFGGWRDSTPESASAFISEYYDRPLKAVAVVEGCNISTGYPYWIVYYKELESSPAKEG